MISQTFGMLVCPQIFFFTRLLPFSYIKEFVHELGFTEVCKIRMFDLFQVVFYFIHYFAWFNLIYIQAFLEDLILPISITALIT